MAEPRLLGDIMPRLLDPIDLASVPALVASGRAVCDELEFGLDPLGVGLSITIRVRARSGMNVRNG